MSGSDDRGQAPDAAAAFAALQPDGVSRPVLGFAGWSGAGKTTLLEALIPRLRTAGLGIALLKHAHHRVDVDQPGKDSHRLRAAGAHQVLLSSSQRRALMIERTHPGEPALDDELRWFDRSLSEACDLILVEGFRDQRLPKIEVHRPALGRPLLFPDDPCIIAIASTAPPQPAPPPQLPLFELDRPEVLARFIHGICRRD
jgi:molybdopterin-guanine dinucleotide biosynthesis adapter protein